MSPVSVSSSKSILLVDDETAVIHITKRMLEMGGYQVTGATTAEEGLKLFASQSWRLVIVDRAMPVMNGEEMAARIKEMDPKMPILMITGFPDVVAHPELYVAVLRKPYASSELLAHVARLGTDAV